MKICLDTNAYIFMKKGNQDLVSVLEQADLIFVPSVVLGELYTGFLMGHHSSTRMKELDLFLEAPGIEVVLLDKDIARRYGEIIVMLKKQKMTMATNDLWITATCFEKGATLISYDHDFKKIPGLSLLSP